MAFGLTPRATADRGSRDHAQERDQEQGRQRQLRGAEQVEVRRRLREPVEQDRARAEGDQHDLGHRPVRLQQPRHERRRRRTVSIARPRPGSGSVAGTGPNGASRPSTRNQTENVSPCIRQASRPNWAIIASVKPV